MSEENQKVLAVDGDVIAYKTAAVCETHFEGACDAIMDSTIKSIATDTQVPHMRIYISGDDNFRYKVATTKPYKGNRATMVRPQFLNYCKDYLVTKYNALIVAGYEADDAIATDMAVNGAYHCGIDKDLLQVPGRHYDYVKKVWTDVSEDEAILTLYRQVLKGDTSDNVPGLPRVGETKAMRAIQNPETAEFDARRFYEDTVRLAMAGVDHDKYFAEQFALIYMMRDIPIDFKNTVFVEPETAGFQAQEGGLVEAPAEPKKIVGL